MYECIDLISVVCRTIPWTDFNYKNDIEASYILNYLCYKRLNVYILFFYICLLY